MRNTKEFCIVRTKQFNPNGFTWLTQPGFIDHYTYVFTPFIKTFGWHIIYFYDRKEFEDHRVC